MCRSDDQGAIPGTAPDMAGLAQRKADARLQPAKAQVPCDVGLFSDDARQVDLEDYLKPQPARK